MKYNYFFRCRQWVMAVGNKDLIYVPIERLHVLKYVCGNHFQSKTFKKKDPVEDMQ
jgi:hypothetical protein